MLTDPAGAAGTPTARPLFIAQESHHLFAWHHPARPSVRRGAAVVLCPSIGGEFVAAYRVWRCLAEQLAALGFDVIRFDYEGTGDSFGDLGESKRIHAWLHNIERALITARLITGSNHVALVGLRIGAILAAHAAAATGGVERLVLWSPCLSGRAYIRELKALGQLSREDHTTIDESPDRRAAGYVLPASVAADLERLDLKTIPGCPAPQVLTVDRDDRPTNPRIGECLANVGSRVTRIRPAGTAATLEGSMLMPPIGVVDAITQWLDGWLVDGNGRVDGEAPASLGSAVVHGCGYYERAIRFGADDRLFGILSVPNCTDVSAPAIILLNTGIEYRVGPHRLYVPLAREWAAQGYTVFRYDLGGLGDSDAPTGVVQNVAYPVHALDDARDAVEFIRTQAPGRPVILAGLCAGGWHAFRAACEGLRIDGIVSINPPLYLRDSGPSVRSGTSPRGEMPAAIRGRSCHLTFLQKARHYLLPRVKRRVNAFLGGRVFDGLARDLHTIAARGIRSLFVFSRGDTGLEYFQRHGSAELNRRDLRDCMRCVVVDNAGHTFSPQAAQHELRALLFDYVERLTRESRRARVESSRAVERSVPYTSSVL